jgi:hypothetical protein
MIMYAPHKHLLLLLLASSALIALDNHHFYRASNFFPVYHEPRLAKPGLMSIDFTFGGGATSTGLIDPKNYNASCIKPCCDDKTNILNICGAYNMQALGAGVPGKDPENPLDAALINLQDLPTRDFFGYLAYCGHFSILEANFLFTQNFSCGFFFQAHFPVRRLSISNIRYLDCSPDDNEFPNRNTPAWQTFLSLFDQILAQYELNTCPFHKTGLGDTTLMLGWTHNYEQTEILDYFDFTFHAGILLPTAPTKNIHQVFSLPLGYDGHIGIPISFDLGLGIYDWFTLGFHCGAMPFLDKVKQVRVQTAVQQQGPIELATACLCVKEGTLWDVNAYVKADHCIAGFSLLLGYTYAQKEKATFNGISACQEIFCPRECDFSYGAWNMHTLHALADFDSALCFPNWGPHISFFINGVVGGKNVFKTPVGGIQGGINVVWSWC